MSNATKYERNSKLSRDLCNKMEKLLALTKYDTWFMRNENVYRNNLEILRLQKQLDTLWDKQIELKEL